MDNYEYERYRQRRNYNRRVTHKKRTMEYANSLYGITMQEKGVSTMVSVNLIEDQLNDMEKAYSK